VEAFKHSLTNVKFLCANLSWNKVKKIQFLNVQKRTDLRRKKNYLVVSCFSGGGNENVGTAFIDAANTGNNDIRNSKGFAAYTRALTRKPL